MGHLGDIQKSTFVKIDSKPEVFASVKRARLQCRVVPFMYDDDDDDEEVKDKERCSPRIRVPPTVSHPHIVASVSQEVSQRLFRRAWWTMIELEMMMVIAIEFSDDDFSLPKTQIAEEQVRQCWR